MGSSQEMLNGSVPGAVPQIDSGPVGLLYHSMKTVGSKDPGGGDAQTEQC